jgi:hypothetical protein
VELETGLISTFLDLKFSLTGLGSEIVDVTKPWANSGFSACCSEGNWVLNSLE